MTFSFLSLTCLLTLLPSPPVAFENSFLQLFPLDIGKCPSVDLSKYITFTLYTKYNPLEAQTLKIGDDRLLEKSYIDFSKPTVVYFHAFFEDSTTTSGSLLRSAYTLRGEHNFIMVSSRQLYAGPWYPTAAKNTQIVGIYAARFLAYLFDRGLNPKKLHLIGHSLGAQAAGVTGYVLGRRRPARITGLDPALPLFQKLPFTLRLDRNDADFVDIIHTDSGGFGISAPMGHADFYVNGGKSPQPGCELAAVVPRKMLLEKFFCSHWRSFQLFAESVLRPEAFPSVPCALGPLCRDPYAGKLNGPLTYLGYGLSPLTRGVFYVKTSPTSPYNYYIKNF